jgi:hypothetical protein
MQWLKRIMAFIKAMTRRLTGWWKGDHRGKSKPAPIRNITSEIDMAKNVTVRWDLPTVRQSGNSLPLEEIEHVIAEISADGGANFGNLDVITPSAPQSVFVPDLEPGEWHFRFTVVDTGGKRSKGVTHVETVADETPPGEVTNITSTQD